MPAAFAHFASIGDSHVTSGRSAKSKSLECRIGSQQAKVIAERGMSNNP
ncbi:MAG: hypothetical protein MJZ19_01990 [Paludibacteraceae bacterium]|nr:hypothetical protein [Paludibacteraceae bacterium]